MSQNCIKLYHTRLSRGQNTIYRNKPDQLEFKTDEMFTGTIMFGKLIRCSYYTTVCHVRLESMPLEIILFERRSHTIFCLCCFLNNMKKCHIKLNGQKRKRYMVKNENLNYTDRKMA